MNEDFDVFFLVVDELVEALLDDIIHRDTTGNELLHVR
jgi:hypothetical protein